MKQNGYRICLYILMVISGSYIQGCMVTSAQPRIWDVALTVQSVTDVAESKLCDLIQTVSQDFVDTNTVIQAINSKVTVVSSDFIILESEIDSVLLNTDTILSKLDVLLDKTTFIDQNIIDIRIDDFGGTWTALQELESTICAKFENALSDLNTIESQIDQLSVDNLAQFIATFTKLQEVGVDVFDTMTTIQDLSNQITIDLSTLDYLIFSVNSTLDIIASDICLLGISIEYDFAGTFTSIEYIFDKLCMDVSILEEVEIVISNDYVNTFTTIAYLEQEACIIDSKVDGISELASIIKSKLVNII